MAKELLVRKVLDLPDEVPECVVNIRQFDDPAVLAENVRDYVITPRVAQELKGFTRRLHRSVEWHEGGRGHFVHGSFGSGKSHSGRRARRSASRRLLAAGVSHCRGLEGPRGVHQDPGVRGQPRHYLGDLGRSAREGVGVSK